MFYLDGFINDDDLDVIRAKKLIDTVDVFVYQGYLNELETRVYSLSEDEVTLDKINELSAECAEEFEFDAPASIPDYYKYSWVDVPHLYDAPFYVISYCTSCDAALQFYELAEEDRDNAVETYYDLINWDIDQTFTENLQRAGLDSPFDEDSVKECAAAIESYFYE
jgi:oligoendopeptidase F